MVPRTEDMEQEATYWAPTDLVAFGQVELEAPVLIACRWQDTSVLFRSTEGELVTSTAVVYPDRELATQGWLMLGDQTAVADPRGGQGAHEIRQVGASPDLDATEVLHKVWL